MFKYFILLIFLPPEKFVTFHFVHTSNICKLYILDINCVTEETQQFGQNNFSLAQVVNKTKACPRAQRLLKGSFSSAVRHCSIKETEIQPLIQKSPQMNRSIQAEYKKDIWQIVKAQNQVVSQCYCK